ncbi:MAG: hypothetical protein HKP24_09040 [Croceitalea sp.]|nr:hypothetical protein [Croceitalea sp.]
MKKLLLSIVVTLLFTTIYGQEQRTISGKVSDGKIPMQSVNISVLNKDVSTTTNAQGNYQIRVETGDKLQYSYTGMKSITIRVEDVTRILNPIMVPEINELDEVLVEGSRRMSQKDLAEDYVLNKNIIRTAFGYLDADRAAGNVRTIEESDITAVNFNLFNYLTLGRFPGVSVLDGRVFIRGKGSIENSASAIFDVDGQIFTDVPTWLDLGNIKRIALLNNLATTTAYGSIGAGGVFVINTFGASPVDKKIVDRARLKNNYVTERLLTQDDIHKNKPNYLKELEASASFTEAKEVFDSYDQAYHASPYFYLDAHNHFVTKFDAIQFADGMIQDNYGLFEGNSVLLKALAYQYQEQQRFSKANDILKEVFILRPNYAQSYLDMANSYREINEPKMAASIYARYNYLLDEGFMQSDTIGFGPIIEREFNNLLTLDKGAVVNNTNQLFVAQETFDGTRLVFEWNDGEAEFDLQFVNPENQYYSWKHSLYDNENEIMREKDFGYNVKEYLIDNSLPGTWAINITYYGNKSLTPTYLKATVYHNYGTRAQQKETKVFKLSLKDVNHELFKVRTTGGVITK